MTDYVKVPIISITKVSIYDDRTEVSFHLDDQQAAIEHHLNVLSFPTDILFDRDGNLLNLKVDARDLEALAGLQEKMKQ